MQPFNDPFLPPLPPIPPPPGPVGPAKRKTSPVGIIVALALLALPVALVAGAFASGGTTQVQTTAGAKPPAGITKISTPVDSSTTEAPTTTSPPRTTTTLDLDDIKEEAFVQIIQEQYPSLSRAKVLDLGHTVCSTIRSYHGNIDRFMTELVQDDDLDFKMAGYVIGAAIPAFCPEYQAAMDHFTDTYAN